MAYIRRCDSEEILIALNSNEYPQTIQLPLEYQSAEVLLGKDVGATAILEGHGCGVFRLEREIQEEFEKN